MNISEKSADSPSPKAPTSSSAPVTGSFGSFADLILPQQVHRSLKNMKFETPTEVQARTIPAVLEGRDVLVTAETGSGKTAAFGVPVLAQMLREIEAPLAEEEEHNAKYQIVDRLNKRGKTFVPTKRALILAPTRELAEQIATVIDELTWSARRFKHAVIIGGAGYGPQLYQLRQNPAFVIGTPGRLIDHIQQGHLKLDDFAFLVIDEADRLLDMGFEPQIQEIVSRMPKARQTMMFSATLPGGVKKMVESYLRNPVRIAIGTQNRPVDRIKQDVIELSETDKSKALLTEIDKLTGSIIIFTRTRIRADRVAKILNEKGHQADSLHGDLSQGQRRRVTDLFRDEKIRILVATDIAARGLDINHVKHVLNYDLPMVPEDYIHRIGRTARNGAEGHSLSFVNQAERHLWLRILKFTGQPLPKTYSKPPRFSGKLRGPAPVGKPDKQDRGFFAAKTAKGGVKRGDVTAMFDRERDLLAEPSRFGIRTDEPKRAKRTKDKPKVHTQRYLKNEAAAAAPSPISQGRNGPPAKGARSFGAGFRSGARSAGADRSDRPTINGRQPTRARHFERLARGEDPFKNSPHNKKRDAAVMTSGGPSVAGVPKRPKTAFGSARGGAGGAKKATGADQPPRRKTHGQPFDRNRSR